MEGPRHPRLGRHNQRLVELRRIGRGRDPDRTVVDGSKLVAELLGRPDIGIEALYGTAAGLASLTSGAAIARLAAARQVWELDEDTLRSVAPTREPQGLLATVAVPRGIVEARGIVVFLDHIQEPGNVGALVRCGAAFGAAGVACSPGCGDPFAPKAVRAAAGTVFSLPVQRQAEIAELAPRFTVAGGEVTAAVGDAGVPAPRWRPGRPLLLVLGNEGRGPEPATLAHCTSRVTVPLRRGVESLNVAVAAGILLASLAGVVPSPILESGIIRGGRDDSPP